MSSKSIKRVPPVTATEYLRHEAIALAKLRLCDAAAHLEQDCDLRGVYLFNKTMPSDLLGKKVTVSLRWPGMLLETTPSDNPDKGIDELADTPIHQASRTRQHVYEFLKRNINPLLFKRYWRRPGMPTRWILIDSVFVLRVVEAHAPFEILAESLPGRPLSLAPTFQPNKGFLPTSLWPSGQ